MSIVMRKYQEEVLAAVEQGFKKHKEFVIAACPSSGKTQMSLEFIRRTPGKFFIVTHGQNVLKDMWEEELKKSGISSDRVDFDLHVNASRKIKNVYDYVIVDEAHEFVFAKSKSDTMFDKIKKSAKKAKFLYLTGTPSKFIAKGFSDKVNMTFVDPMELIEDGFISPLHIGICTTKADIRERNAAGELTVKSQRNFVKTVSEDMESLLKAMHQRISSVTKNNPEVNRHLNVLPSFGKMGKTMITTASIEQADKVTKWLKSRKISVVTSNSENDKDSENILRFQNDESIKVLVVVNRAILGFNMPELETVVDMGGSANIDRIYQLYARVMRKSPTTKQKYFFKVANVNEETETKFYLTCAIHMLDLNFVTKYNGKNLDGLSIRVRRARNETEASTQRGPSARAGAAASVTFDESLFNAVIDSRVFSNLTNNKDAEFNQTCLCRIELIRREHFGDRVFWTEESLRAEALKFNSRKEFAEGNGNAYAAARHRGKEFLDSICAHMEQKYATHTKESLRLEALKYNSRFEFQKGNIGAYGAAKKRGKEFFDSICSHMKPKHATHTEESLRAEALKYNSKSEFGKSNKSAYNAALRKGQEFFNSICSHMEQLRTTHTEESLREEALKYNSKSEFERANDGAYQAAKKKGQEFFNSICSHMKPKYITWTEEKVTELAKGCKNIKDLDLKSSAAYQFAKRNNLLDKLFGKK